MEEELDLIEQYFNKGHTYSVILEMLSSHHEIHISIGTLKSRLKDLGLQRRGGFSSLNAVRRAISSELLGPGQLFGYRTMWITLKQKHGLRVKRETVMRMLRQLNPRGTLLRARRRFIRRTYHSMGPNYLWHVDGYDKLKPFGFAISGCIDGFSRRIMWLKCGPTNNNPEVIKNNFIDCIRSVGVVPMKLRTDCGTENGDMAAVQCTLRHHHSDYHAGARSHLFGSSTSNQRIESWWSLFRKQRGQFWMELFGDLRDKGLFNGTHEHLCLLRFCFMGILQADLDECVQLWNSHRIRPSRHALCPGGIPDELYSLPHRFGSRDCGFAVEEASLTIFQEGPLNEDPCGDPDIHEYLEQAMQQGLQQPHTWQAATELYITQKNIAGL
ncbi:uncharacterized protein LOC117828944 [Notolabrus celidotus]|uniref:uncharacterized protein LOC117828944 n=1 Tax=Notolabrus celidotus TaxID=1203425 RepID=UPI001490291B|nr:uncharacterized protein LOC117828944 [Notolabrus celidotus]